MAADKSSKEQEEEETAADVHENGSNGKNSGRIKHKEQEDEDEEETDDEEPRLKYAPLTRGLAALYRNGDATSAFLVAGDKMVGGRDL